MQFLFNSLIRFRSFQLGLVVTCILFAVGCEKKEKPVRAVPSPSETSKSVNVTAEESAPAPPIPSAAAPAAATAAAPDAPLPEQAPANQEQTENALRDLSFMVSEYRALNNRLPRDLNVFVELKYYRQLPAAPAGKQFRLDHTSGKVVLENVK